MVVDGGRNNLAQVVGFDEVEHITVGDKAFVEHVDGRDEGGAAGHL